MIVDIDNILNNRALVVLCWIGYALVMHMGIKSREILIIWNEQVVIGYNRLLWNGEVMDKNWYMSEREILGRIGTSYRVNS